MFRIALLLTAGLPAFSQTWVTPSGGAVPALAVRAGTDINGAALYVCRTTDAQSNTHIGKFAAALGCVYFANGLAVSASSYQVLTDYSADWQAAGGGSIPANSYAASTGVYVCRAGVENSRQVGQLRSGSAGCAIEFGGTGGVFTNYEVMWSPWFGASNGSIPSGAVQTGQDSGGPLYTCRATISGNRQIGKLRADFTGCRIGLGGSITVATTYEVLVNFNASWQVYNTAVPEGGAFYAGSSGGQPKYVCRFTIGGTTDLTPGQTGGPSAEQPNQCRVEYQNSTKDQGSFQALLKNDPPGVCQYGVSPTTINAPAGGNTTTITVTGTCGWVNFPSASWLQPSVRSGTGGTFTLTVAPNPSSTPRTGEVILAGGQKITVNQAGGCSYVVSPTSATAPASGGSRNFTVTTTAGCSWSVTNATSWLTPSPLSGNGSGSVNVQVAQNTALTPRTGSLAIAGQIVSITQDGVCAYNVTPTTAGQMEYGGGTLTFTPTTASSCTANVTGPSWVTIAPTQPTGAFTVTFQPNNTYANRMGSINVANIQTIDLDQLGRPCTLTINPASVSIPSTGGPVSIQITAPSPTCQWSTSNNTLNFVSFSTPLTGAGNSTITGSALATSQARSGTMQINSYRFNQTVTVSQTGGGCNYTVAPTSLNLTAALQGAALTVTTTAGCPISFAFGAPWISFIGAGSGSGTYTLNVQENTGYAARNQTFTIGSTVITASQAGRPCTLSLSPPPTVPASGGQFSINVTVPSPTCQWTVTETSPFLQLNTTSGTGNGSITGTVDPNTSASARNASLQVNSYLSTLTASVNQAGLNCTYTLAPTSASFPASGGTRTFIVTTASGCSWNAVSSDPSWITFSGTTTGNGNGSFVANIAANPNSSSRTGSVSAGGLSATLTQEGSACAYSLSLNGISISAAGRSDMVGVTASAGCSWTASSPVSWVTITSGTGGTGNGSVAFTVLANPGAAERSATLTIAGKSFTVNQAGTAGQLATGLTFVSLAPCRILETRQDYNFEGRTGVFGPPFMARGDTRTLPMNGSSLCPIPTSAKAYVINVTLVPRGSVDFVTVWPAGETRPNVWTIRSPDGNTVANSAIVKAGANGGISIYASDNTDLLIDVAGYYTDNRAISNLVYYPLTPCRVIDTRLDYRNPGPFGPPSMASRETRRFRFPASPCLVPQGAAAYSMTITAVPQGPLQFLTAWPAGGQQPNVSSINSPAGRTLANSVILPTSADGSLDVFTFNQTDFLIDINGYFAPDDGVSGQFYFPVTQCRASDSTVSGGIYGDDSFRTINVPTAVGCNGIPSTARGYALNVTALPSGSPMPFVTAYPTGQVRPNASILNAFEGQIVTNSAIVPANAAGAIDVYAYRRTHLVVEISGYFGR